MCDTGELWLKSSVEFNNWRRGNDLPKLVLFFKEALPHFEEWQQQFSVTDELLLKSDQTSEFFIGEGIYVFCFYKDPWGNFEGIQAEELNSFLKSKEWADQNNQKIQNSNKFICEEYARFEPYFFWLKNTKGISKFEVRSQHGTGAQFDDFRYNHWTGDSHNSYSAQIFGRYDSLNLGGVKIRGRLLRGRNLDFTNLDGLQVFGRGVMGSTFSRIRYASCRGLSLMDLDMPFLEFQRCHFSEVQIIKCDMHDLHLIKVDGSINKIHESRLTKFIIDACCPIGWYTDLNRANLPEFIFVNHSAISAENKYNFYSQMRKASQDFGYSHQAQENFYLERKYKMFFESDPNNLYEYRIVNHPKLSDLFLRVRKNGFRIDKTISSFWRATIQQTRSFSRKKLLFPYLAFRFRSLLAWVNFTLWGFGERPWRVVFWMIGDILIFAIFYYLFHFHNSFSAALLHSMYVFTTVGYNTNVNSALQYAVAIQALSGVFFSGLFLSSLVNKVRY